MSDRTFSREDFPANLSAWQDDDADERMNGGSGRSSPASFASYDPDTSCWKMSQVCLFEEWERSLETWPASGMMRGGKVYRQRPLVHRTSVGGCSLWPTPTVNGNNNRAGCSPTSGDGLATAVKKWPTPAARESRGPNKNGRFGDQLPNAVGGQLNPTWVEWLQGFPLGWTDCEDSGTP